MAKYVVHRRQSICLTFSRPWVQFLLSGKRGGSVKGRELFTWGQTRSRERPWE